MTTNLRDIVALHVIENLNEDLKLLRKAYDTRLDHIVRMYGNSNEFDAKVQELDKMFVKQRINTMPKLYGVQMKVIKEAWKLIDDNPSVVNGKSPAQNLNTSGKQKTSRKTVNSKDNEKTKSSSSSDRTEGGYPAQEPGISKQSQHESNKPSAAASSLVTNPPTTQNPSTSYDATDLFNSYMGENFNTENTENTDFSGRGEFEFEFFFRIKQK